MKRILVITLFALLTAGCGFHRQATVDLSYAVHHYTVKVDEKVQKATAGEALTPEEVEEWKSDSAALARNTKVLAELLGEPSENAQEALADDGRGEQAPLYSE